MGVWVKRRKGEWAMARPTTGRAKNSALRELNFCIKRIRAGFEPFRGAWHPLALANQAEGSEWRIGGGTLTARLKNGAALFSPLDKSWARRVFRPTDRLALPFAHSPIRQPNLRSRAILMIPRDRFVPRRPYKRRHRSVLALRNGRLH
jgi:hypothetical protein